MAFVETTQGITVSVRPVYLGGQSNLLEKKVVFAYFVRIQNDSRQSVQLLRSHWMITDSEGSTQEVEGRGVVGKQPVIHPGEAYEYSSFSVIPTLKGEMYGTYLMKGEHGRLFRIQIPRFTLWASAN